jgi:hypothetical protein
MKFGGRGLVYANFYGKELLASLLTPSLENHTRQLIAPNYSMQAYSRLIRHISLFVPVLCRIYIFQTHNVLFDFANAYVCYHILF